MENKKIRSVQCTSCAGPLELHGGGHKIQSLNCQYCGAVMDVRNEYKLLGKMESGNRPYAPLKIGMSGRLKGIEFTIIGMVGWQASTSLWADFMLFSPTHGYAWLTFNQGHFLFSRKVRILPGHPAMWKLPAKAPVSVGRDSFRFFESYEASIYYVAGELTWIAKTGDTNLQSEAIAPPRLFAAETSIDTTDVGFSESEYSMGEYIEPAEVAKAFDMASFPKPIGVHPAQPYKKSWIDAFAKSALPFALLSLLIAFMIMIFLPGKSVHEDHISVADYIKGKTSVPFNVTDADRLIKLEMSSNMSNAWAWFTVAVRSKDKELKRFAKEISFYEGHDSDGYWSEGSQSATAYFKVPEPGTYSIEVMAADASFKRQGSTRVSPQVAQAAGSLSVKVSQGYVNSRYFWMLALLMGVITILGYFKQYYFENQRWRPVIGDD